LILAAVRIGRSIEVELKIAGSKEQGIVRGHDMLARVVRELCAGTADTADDIARGKYPQESQA
jgi:hypothetical protein